MKVHVPGNIASVIVHRAATWPRRFVVLAALLAVLHARAADPAADWRRHEFAREGFSCEMPGAPEPLDSEGAAHFQVAVSVAEPKALLVARTRAMPARAAGKAEPFFDTVAEQLEASGARVVGRQAADLGLHRGSMVAAKREDGTLEVVRSVVVGRTVCELHAILSPDAGQAGRELAGRFLGSLQLVR